MLGDAFVFCYSRNAAYVLFCVLGVHLFVVFRIECAVFVTARCLTTPTIIIACVLMARGRRPQISEDVEGRKPCVLLACQVACLSGICS